MTGIAPLRNVLRSACGLTISFDVPERVAVAVREHNRMAKTALRDTMQEWIDRALPGHFTRDAHGKYHYQERSTKYGAIKQRLFGTGALDLVQTGRSRDSITKQAKITAGGTAEGGTLKGNIAMRFSFAEKVQKHYAATGGRKKRTAEQEARRAGGVTIATMKNEVRRMTPAERVYFTRRFAERYSEEYRRLRAGRKRNRWGLAGGGGGGHWWRDFPAAAGSQ